MVDLDIDIVAGTSQMRRRYNEQNVLRLEVAMNDTLTSKQFQTAGDAVGGPARRRQRKPAVASPLQRLVQVDAERLEHDARVTSKLEVIQHADNVCLAVGVGSRQKTQHPYLVERLTAEAVVAANYLERDPAVCLVIVRAQYLTETAATQHFEHLVTAHTSSTHTHTHTHTHNVNYTTLHVA